VLMTLGQRSPITQRELARVAGIDPRNAVPIIDALERRGFLERRPDPSDRRRHAVVLTPAGRDLMQELQAAGASLEVEMLRDLTDAERRTLTSLLLRVFLSMTEG
jgi:DNA-binding MarR family transcriptional regulator